MPLILNVPDSAWSESTSTLNGITYRFIYKYNGRDKRWRLSIRLVDSTPVIEGVKIMENQSLLSRYRLDNFSHGDIFCVRIQQDNKPVGRKNLGIGLPYELVYFNNRELESIGVL